MTLFENFNTSNQTSPHFEKHENFVVDLQDPGCIVVQTLEREERCAFVEKTDACREAARLVDYTYFFYCTINPTNILEDAFGVFLLLIVVAAMYHFTGSTIDLFFCPALTIVTKKLDISENLAGATLLAMGNSLPDIISNFYGTKSSIANMYSDLMGSAMFVTCFIGGAVIYMRPMKLEASTFVRDVGFLMLAIIYIEYAIKGDKNISFNESCVIMGIYFTYFIILALDHIILLQTIKNLRKQIKQQDVMTEAQAARLEKLIEQTGIELVFKPRPGLKINYAETASEESNTSNQQMFEQFLYSLRPHEIDAWREGGFLRRSYIIMCTPINVILLALVPTVDHNLERHGWSKLLNCIQIVLLPYVIFRTKGSNVEFYSINSYNWSMIVTVIIAIVVFCITRTDRQPKFHILFAIFSLAGSIFLIRIFTREFQNICKVIGMITYRTQSFLGVTLVAWGEDIGDMIASLYLSKQGYQKMGFAASIAGPLFFITFTMGGILFFRTMETEDHLFRVPKGSMGENCTIFLMLCLSMFLFGAASTNFNCRRSLGVYMIIIYLLFLMYCIFGEYEIMHPYGTDHTEDFGLNYL